MNSSEKTKREKEIQAKIESLEKEGDAFYFSYNDEVFEFELYAIISTSRAQHYAVSQAKRWGKSMNVDTITRSSIKLYTFPMLGKMVEYSLPLSEMTIVEKPTLE